MRTAYISAFLARSICTHCLPGPSSTQEPSLPSLSPSSIMSSVPTLGLLSLDVTFLPLARFIVPAGTIKSGRLPFVGGSRLGTWRGAGVPTNRGGGSWVFKTTFSWASAAVATSSTGKTKKFVERLLIIYSSSHFFGGNGNSGLRGNGVVGLMNRVFAGESFIARAIQFCRAADGVEKVLQVRLMGRLIEEHRNFILRQLCGFAHVHFRSALSGGSLGGDIALLNQVVP